MDQDSASSESRERCLSSEPPSSTRPNPFGDGADLSARKRRRTSKELQDDSAGPIPTTGDDVAADSSRMKLDSPEPDTPSTPARPPPATTEPVSSKVTLNLRKTNSQEATPDSPPSPTPARYPSDQVRASIEASETEMTTEEPRIPAARPKHTNAPVVLIDDDDDSDDPDVLEVLGPDAKVRAFLEALADFPYTSPDETYSDTVGRLSHFFQQPNSQLDEALEQLENWLRRVLAVADNDVVVVFCQAYLENRSFWQNIPELFAIIWRRSAFSKSPPTRHRNLQLAMQFCRLSAFLVNVDIYTMAQLAAIDQPTELDLIAPAYLHVVGWITRRERDDSQDTLTLETIQDVGNLLDAFQSSQGGSMHYLGQYVELLAALLPKSPRKAADHLYRVSSAVESLARYSNTRASYSGPRETIARSRDNLKIGFEYFETASGILATCIDKFTNHLPPEATTGMIGTLTDLFKFSLQSTHARAVNIVADHRAKNPSVSPPFTAEAIALEWRFDTFAKIVKSRQMQLRVSAVSCMCSDLITQWKKYNERDKVDDEDGPRLQFLRYLSSCLIDTGVVDYILGPTCHPEITQESANVVGFLMVTKTYTPGRTDLWWQTATTTQDPRIMEALIRMMLKILHLCDFEHIAYLCEKLVGLPVDGFNISMRELFDQVARNYVHKFPLDAEMSQLVPYELCIRLLQESSIYGPQCTIAFPDVQVFAHRELAELIKYGLSDSNRRELALVCLQDIESKSASTPGSLQALGLLTPSLTQVQWLVMEHDLSRLLIEELDASIKAAHAAGFLPVFSHPDCAARRKLISAVVASYGSTIDPELGQLLWDRLVGLGAACPEDRKVAWEDLTGALKRARYAHGKSIRSLGGFLADCLGRFLPQLPPACYSLGTLEFVREDLLPQVNDLNSSILGDETRHESNDLELLWQMVLTSPPLTIENKAIHTLVHDIYVESQLIKSLPLNRARKVHFSLVARCLQQLKYAAQKLQSYSDGFASGDDESMVIVATDDQQQEQELHFVRSLKVLSALLRAVQGRSHFTAADLRALMLPRPSPVEGGTINIKYQAFDGDDGTEITTLEVGLKNTIASLLASLRDASGFENFRLYFQGKLFMPTDTDACKTIEETRISSGLILIKKETFEAPSSPRRIKPGASSLDIEILSHFKDLWEYLSLDEKLAGEIYDFLVKLPADDSILAIFENPNTVHRDIFPPGQPFKSLYALHALKEYLNTRQVRQSMVSEVDTAQFSAGDKNDVLTKVAAWVIAAICDPDISTKGGSESLLVLLNKNLVGSLVQLLKESPEAEPFASLLTEELQHRLLNMMAMATKADTANEDLITGAFEAMLESCAKSRESWAFLRSRSDDLTRLTRDLLLLDDRSNVRQGIGELIGSKTLYDPSSSSTPLVELAEFFWVILLEILPQAASEPSKCEETFRITLQLLKMLHETDSSTLSLKECIQTSGSLILSHKVTEDVSSAEKFDIIAHGLITLLHNSIKYLAGNESLNETGAAIAKKLYSKHLFPPKSDAGPLVQPVIVNPSTRNMLYEIILMLVRHDRHVFVQLLQNIHGLTPYMAEPEDDPYLFDLPQQFDRAKAVRAPCGYAGLRNLSNTCYLNSLLTQLFMNIEFRQFILECPVSEGDTNQLLQETQSLFANLQESRRRFIDPQQLVAQITTYEETQIDIHNQMDVDEFYNLLFDRWEGQMPSQAAKKRLKSIYGGDLVQQVKSQECPHISERVEPFSAIQCDVKGKGCLEESLQAYVDGEIMEGDNKYKCSDCDRHVDAVKRACLKNLPDHLIFHLKRFDFNLRTLQRNKINDYFSFPSKINMQPYTVEHLTGPSRESEPDVFELTGVLVHSGTAESGHYYSFIRESPSEGKADSWFEFNDDIVNSWDPASMEAACFGGQQQDFRHFETGNSYEKVYSAYMLFYTRSSSLKKKQTVAGDTRQPGPLRCNLPRTFADQIRTENWHIVQRHCIYDPAHIPFVCQLLSQVWGDGCSEDHKLENLAMQIALGHLDQVASRAKDLPDFEILCNVLTYACNRCPKCCLTFFSFLKYNPEVLRMLLQKNADMHVRQDTRRMLNLVLRSIKTNFPGDYDAGDALEDNEVPESDRSGNIITDTVILFSNLFDMFHCTLRSWPDVFGSMVDFAQLGRLEAAALIEGNFLWRSSMMILADPALENMPTQYMRMLNNVSRRTSRPASFEQVIALIDVLLQSMDVKIESNRIVEAPESRSKPDMDFIPFTAEEVNLFHRDWTRNRTNMFVESLIQTNQNHASTQSIITRLMQISSLMETRIQVTLRSCITYELVGYMVSPFLSAAVTFCLQSTNEDQIRQLINHVIVQCRRGVNNSEGRSFFDFFREVFDATRNTGESVEEIELQSLEYLHKWVPGLVGAIDYQTSVDLEDFLHQKLLGYGCSPDFGDSESAQRRSQAMNQAAKALGVSCLMYLKETYVARRVQAARDTVRPLENTIKACHPYFDADDMGDEDDRSLDGMYQELRPVLESMARLTVDEIEDEGSDWENSIGSSEPMESLADLSMQVDREPL